jgi:hypothetical protein
MINFILLHVYQQDEQTLRWSATFLCLPSHMPRSARVMKRRWAPLAVLLIAAACLHSRTAASQQSSTALQQACGGLGQQCCARCPPGTPASGEPAAAGGALQLAATTPPGLSALNSKCQQACWPALAARETQQQCALLTRQWQQRHQLQVVSSQVHAAPS